MALNIPDLMDRRTNSKRQIYEEEVKELTQTNTKQKPRRKYNFDFLLTRPRGQKNMGMDSIGDGMFGKGMF